MIAVTERAKQELKGLLSEKVDNPLAVLRLISTDQGQLGLSIDIEAPADKVVEHEGAKVLVVEPELAGSLEGVTLDVEDTPQGPRLATFREPPS